MDAVVKEHVAKWEFANMSLYWRNHEKINSWQDIKENDIADTILMCNPAPFYSETIKHYERWKEVFCVKEIDGMLIGYVEAVTGNSTDAMEQGWEFDKNSICRVEKVGETYKKVVSL
jgi:hypothetical protein